MHMKSDALKTVSQVTENNSCEEKKWTKSARTWNRFFVWVHISHKAQTVELKLEEKKCQWNYFSGQWVKSILQQQQISIMAQDTQVL